MNQKPDDEGVDLRTIYDEPVVLLRNFKFKDEDEVMKYLQSATFKDQRVDCIAQDPGFIGFPPKDPRVGMSSMKLKGFIKNCYRKESEGNSSNTGTRYGIGVRIRDLEMLGKLNDRFKHYGLEEASPISGFISGHTREGLNASFRGVNIPEVLIKLDGAWTGGHTEYLGVRAANVQLHGTGRSTWICVPEHLYLRERLTKQIGYDIRKHETQWYMDLDILLTHGVRATVVHQEKVGDLVLLGPDVMHWVRAKGKPSVWLELYAREGRGDGTLFPKP